MPQSYYFFPEKYTQNISINQALFNLQIQIHYAHQDNEKFVAIFVFIIYSAIDDNEPVILFGELQGEKINLPIVPILLVCSFTSC